MVAPCGIFWESEHKGMSVLVFSTALPDYLSLKKLGYLKVHYKSKLDRAKGLSGMLYEKKQKPVNLHFHTKPKQHKQCNIYQVTGFLILETFRMINKNHH